MPADNGDAEGAGAPRGLSWSYEMDFGALIAAITGAGPPDPDERSADGSVPAAAASSPAPGSAEEEAEQEAILGDLAELDARAAAEGRGDGGRVPLAAVAGRVAERLVPGPDLAAWLATAPVAGLDDGDLAAVAGSWRRVASWAQAGELAAVAQMASRAAARDENAGTDADGRPSQVTPSAAAEVALELIMSQYGASAWAHLAVQLTWRLAGTGTALAAGVIDLARARLIAEATSPLGDEKARAVEARVLPAAGSQTTGMLRAALRRAAAAQGVHRRPGPHLPVPQVPATRLARRPRPHNSLRRRRDDLSLQPRRSLPHPPPAETPPRLEIAADRPRCVRLDHPGRPHLHHDP